MRCELVGDVIHEDIVGQIAAWCNNDPRCDAFAEVVIGNPEDCRLDDVGVFEQGCLDLAGTDAVAARLDQVGRAATCQTEHAVVVE